MNLRMRRILVVFIVLTMLFSVLACSKKTADVKSDEKTSPSVQDQVDKKQEDIKEKEEEESVATINFDKKLDINVFQWGPRDIDPEDEIIKHLNEKLNINLNIQRVLAKEYVENLEIKLAANDIPDLFRLQDSAKHIYNNLYKDDYLANFSEYAEKYNLVSLKNWFEAEGVADYAEEDGFYRLPTRDKPAGAAGNLIVRKDWMDQLGLENPKDYEEFEAMLKAFKDNNMGGENTVPLTGVGIDHTFVAGFYGANGWKQVDGEWVDVRILPEFKEGIKYVRNLYSQGLIDKEIFTLNETQSRGKFVSGIAGIVIPSGGLFDRFTQYEQLLKESIPDAEASTIDPLPAGPAGIVYLGSYGLYSSIYVPKVDRDEELISRVMALTDYIFSEEGKDILVHGIEGIHYTMENGKKVTTEAYDRDIIIGIGHLFAMCSDYAASKLNINDVVDRSFEIGTKYAAYSPVPNSYVSDVVSEYTTIVNDVHQEWWVNFITGEKDVDNEWDNYVQAMNNAGLDKITEDINQFLSQK